MRFFEADISLTSNGTIVLFHDGDEKRFGLRPGFTEEEFLATRPYGATLLNAEGLAEFFVQHPDAYLITDVKDDNFSVLTELLECFIKYGLDAKKIIIPQIYNPSEFDKIRQLQFSRYIFTVYRFKKKMKQTATFLRNNPEFCALTVPEKWVNKG